MKLDVVGRVAGVAVPVLNHHWRRRGTGRSLRAGVDADADEGRGNAIRVGHLHPARNEKHQIKLQPGDWQRLIESVDGSPFLHLPERIEARSGGGKISVVTDDDLLCITVKTRESVHRVCGEDHAIRATADGKRFLEVWERLVGIAPEPK